METHSSVLVWEISWTEEPGGQQSMGSQKSQPRLKRLRMHTPADLIKACALNENKDTWAINRNRAINGSYLLRILDFGVDP